MGQVLHGGARTTAAVRRAIQLRQGERAGPGETLGSKPDNYSEMAQAVADAPMVAKSGVRRL